MLCRLQQYHGKQCHSKADPANNRGLLRRVNHHERYQVVETTKRQLIFGGAGQGLQVDMFHHSWGKLSQLLEIRIQVLVRH